MREDSMRPTCHLCDSNRATHLCEDCSATLCTDCLETRTSQYTVCNECHHNLGIPISGEKFDICPECESENLGRGRRVEEICPRCHSTTIVSIEEKKRGLAQDLRQAIMSIHHGHTKLREFNNALVSAKRLLVSLRMANFLHYNWLEENLESVQNEVEALKNRITAQAEIAAKKMAAETTGIIDYGRWSTSQFPFIEGITNRVMQMGEHYKISVDESLKEARTKLDDVKRQLDGLDYYRKKFSGFFDAAELTVNELPVCALPEIKVTGSDFLRNDKATGSLYITNKRLVFIAETGLVRKKMEVLFDFPLLYLNSIEEDGRIRKRLVLKLKQGEVKLASSEQTQKVLPDYIEIARKFDRYMQTDLQRVRKIEQVNINISDVRMKVEGLVYSLLSPGPQIPTDRGIPPIQAHYSGDEWSRISSNPWRYRDSSYATPEFKRELGRTINNRDSYRKEDFVIDSKGPASLQRNIMELDHALSETVELLRSGRIVPMDFIRRYRHLMRDSYNARREMESIQRSSSGSRW